MRGLVLWIQEQLGLMKPQEIQDPSQRRKEKQRFALAIGNHIRKLREKASISQENLSLKAGYYRTYVKRPFSCTRSVNSWRRI